MNDRIRVAETPAPVDQEVTVKAWVHRVRNHGKVLFIDLCHASGLLQVEVSKKSKA